MKTNLQIVADHYAASARQDIAGMMAEVSPAVAWTEMAGFPYAGTWIGPEQVIAKVFAVLGSEWEDYRFSPRCSRKNSMKRCVLAGNRRVSVIA